MKKKIPNSLFPLMGKRRPLMAVFVACMAANGVWAQEESSWVGEPLPAEGGEFYLYNKEGGGFLLGANTWGTQASLGQPGLLCTLEVMPDGKYAIKTTANNYLKDDYIDKDKTGYIFTDQNIEDEVYEFSLFGNGRYLHYNGSGTVLARVETVDVCEWILVSKDQRIKALDNATEEQGIDATFYVTGANFDRSQPSEWKESHTGGTLTLIGPDRAAKSTNSCTEAYDNANFEVYQVMTGLKNGCYLVSCQGYYRPGGNVDANGAQNAILYANADETPLQLLKDDGKGIPNNMEQAADAFLVGRYGGNEVRTVVMDGTLRIGVRKDVHISKDWAAFDNFRLTYLGEADASEAFQQSLKMLETLIADFTVSGATAIATELQEVYDKNKDVSGDGIEVAQKALSEVMAEAKDVQVNVDSLVASIKTAESLYAKVEDGTYTLSTKGKEALEQGITEAERILQETQMSAMGTQAPVYVEILNAQVRDARLWMGMIYPLEKAKELADAITGLGETDAYRQVVSDLDDVALTFEKVTTDVAALNLVCRNAMTMDFLSKATSDAPIDMTCFIQNPNIYQVGENKEAPDGWVVAALGENNSPDVTTGGKGDAALWSSSWSSNENNNVGKAHYYTKIGGTGNRVANLPDGTYLLKAATYCTRDAANVNLYGSLDNVNMEFSDFNGDEAVYNAATGVNNGSTTELRMDVSGGVLYLGVKGEDIVHGNGQHWEADNFRLYYIGVPESASQAIRISDAGMATYYSANAFTVPEGLEAGVVTGISDGGTTLAVDWRYASGSTVPGLTGILLRGKAGGYTGNFSVANMSRPEDNLLEGTLVETTVDAEGYKYYKLADDVTNGLGFYFATQDGSSIVNGANKAYLALPEAVAQEANFLAFDFDATGITDTELTAEEAPVDVYGISGIRVRSGVKASEALEGLPKGIYIINGRKILK